MCLTPDAPLRSPPERASTASSYTPTVPFLCSAESPPLLLMDTLLLAGRLPFTSTYLGSMVLTLYAALLVQSYLLVLLFSCMQGAALAWYLLSYIPGGAPILKVVTKPLARAMRAVYCRCTLSAGNALLPL